MRTLDLILPLILMLGYNTGLSQVKNHFVTLASHFERTQIKNRGIEERTRGTFFFTFPNAMMVYTVAPVRQQVEIKNNTMSVFYPLENKAIVIRSERQIELPFIPIFLQGLEKDFGFSKLGAQLIAHHAINDTLITHWQLKNEKLKINTSSTLKSVKNRVISVHSYDSINNSSSQLLFKDFVRTPRSKFMASTVVVDKYAGTERFTETITLRDVKFDMPLPDSVIYFKIPPGANITETEW